MKIYLAPLNKLGNAAFRELVLNYGADIVFSEMIRCKQLIESDEVQIRKATISSDLQNKTILQIICEDELSDIPKGVRILKTLNPHIKEINYNMGCPQSTLCKNFNGGGILKNPEKLKEVCRIFANACIENDIKPSIKTRIGLSRDKITVLETLKTIKDAGIKKVYIHGRVLGEPYSKCATYDEIILAKEKFPNMEIIANGDICDLSSYEKLILSKIDGIMIGRCALEYPDIFMKLKKGNFRKENSGENIADKKDIILHFLELAKKYDLPNSHIKSNLAYLTKGCKGGAEVRKSINNVNGIYELKKFIIKNV